MKKRLILGSTALAVLLPAMAFAKAPCLDTEMAIVNKTGKTITIKEVKEDKGRYSITTGSMADKETRVGTMSDTKDGTSRGKVVLSIDGEDFTINYDYHTKKLTPWDCMKEIKSPTGGATANYSQSLTGQDIGGNSRDVVITPK